MAEQNPSTPVQPLAEREPTRAEIDDACMWFDHAFGMKEGDERLLLQTEGVEWLRAWCKVFGWPVPTPVFLRDDFEAELAAFREGGGAPSPAETGTNLEAFYAAQEVAAQASREHTAGRRGQSAQASE